MNKPPLGVSPSWIAIPDRIKDLSDAISRYAKKENICEDDIENIKKWATEIVCHCNTIQQLYDSKGE